MLKVPAVQVLQLLVITRESLWLSERSVCCLRPFIVMIFNFQPCKLQNANLFLPIGNTNHCLSLGLTKTAYEMSFNHEGHSTQSISMFNHEGHSTQYLSMRNLK